MTEAEGKCVKEAEEADKPNGNMGKAVMKEAEEVDVCVNQEAAEIDAMVWSPTVMKENQTPDVVHDLSLRDYNEDEDTTDDLPTITDDNAQKMEEWLELEEGEIRED